MGRETNHQALSECIGVVNQAITKLELPSNKPTSEKQQPAEIEYPSKITLKWLYLYVPWSFWAYLIGLLMSAFSLGVFVSETDFYKSLKSNPVKQTVELKKT